MWCVARYKVSALEGIMTLYVKTERTITFSVKTEKLSVRKYHL